jgi:D-glycero-alpha-D-manno-heptose-7-phosphate kinase
MALITTGTIESFLISEFTVHKLIPPRGYAEGSVRVDLLGGTLDLNPINLILPNVVTLNLATSLKAKVNITELDYDGVEIVSRDYNSTDRFKSSDFTEANFQKGFFGNLSFIAHLLNLFGIHKGVRLELVSGSPPGAGLGGSSAMGVTCYAALSQYEGLDFDRIDAIQKVNSIEARILDCGPAGYQDYYPALFGGVLGLVATPGKVHVEQLYTDELKEVLESHITLVYSGETRLSGINNWEVYKAFFNKDKLVRAGLTEIALLSHHAFLTVQKKDYTGLIPFIGLEGEERRKLFPGILTQTMQELHSEIKSLGNHFGMKVCGAGGGGCFLLTHKPADKNLVETLIDKFHMKKLEFNIEKPL